MTTPSGTISLNNVNVELGLAGTTTISMNQTNVRTLAGVPSGAISMQNLQNKSNRVTASATISANTTNYTLNTAKAPGYSAGKTDMTLTISSGVYVYSTSTGSYALTVDTSWAAGDTVTIVNSGTILGAGGNGGPGYVQGNGSPGTNAGPALYVQRATSINNVNRIAGGGGGGGGGAYGAVTSGKSTYYTSGSGGGGGIGNGGGGGTSYLGSPGTAGTLTAAGPGGIANPGGAETAGGPGGGYGTSGTSRPYGGTGGAAGGAVVGNANITWIAVGTRNGAIT